MRLKIIMEMDLMRFILNIHADIWIKSLVDVINKDEQRLNDAGMRMIRVE